MTGRSTGRSLWTEAEAQAGVSAGGRRRARLREGRGHRGRAPKMPVYTLENLGGAGKPVARGPRCEPSLSLQLARLGANWGRGQRLGEETQADCYKKSYELGAAGHSLPPGALTPACQHPTPQHTDHGLVQRGGLRA